MPNARQEVPTLSSAPPLPTASTNTAVHPTTMIQAAVLYCFRDAIIRIRIFTVSGARIGTVNEKINKRRGRNKHRRGRIFPEKLINGRVRLFGT